MCVSQSMGILALAAYAHSGILGAEALSHQARSTMYSYEAAFTSHSLRNMVTFLTIIQYVFRSFFQVLKVNMCGEITSVYGISSALCVFCVDDRRHALHYRIVVLSFVPPLCVRLLSPKLIVLSSLIHSLLCVSVSVCTCLSDSRSL